MFVSETIHRYIEIFRSSLSEVSSVIGFSNKRMSTGPGSGMGYNTRPSPYERGGDRYGGGSNRFQPRGSRMFKGASSYSNNAPGKLQNW